MNLKKYRYLIYFSIFFILLLVLFVSIKPTTEEPSTAEDFPPDTYTVIEESKNDVVENFPDLPIYANAEITQSKYYTEEGGDGYSLELTTNDSVLDVIEWYKDGLYSQDWSLVFESEMTEKPTYFLIEYKKPDIQLDVMAVTQEDGSTRVIITHHYNMGEYGPPAKYE